MCMIFYCEGNTIERKCLIGFLDLIKLVKDRVNSHASVQTIIAFRITTLVKYYIPNLGPKEMFYKLIISGFKFENLEENAKKFGACDAFILCMDIIFQNTLLHRRNLKYN